MANKRRALSRLTVRTKLALGFLLVGLLPLVVFALVTLHVAGQSLGEHSTTLINERSQALGAALDARQTAMLDHVVSYGEWDEFCVAMDQRDRAWVEANSTTWVIENSRITGAQAIATDGTIVSAAGAFEHRSLGAVPVVAAALESGTNETDFTMIDGRLFIIGAGPVVEPGGLHAPDHPSHGVVVFGEPIDDAMLAELAAIVGVRQLSLYDDGRLIVASDDSAAEELPAGTRMAAVTTEGSDSVLYTELRDQSGALQAVLGLKADHAATTVAIRAIRQTAGFALVITLLIALAAAVVAVRVIVRPLKKLAAGASAIAEGATGQRVDIESHDEFGEVATAFNAMSSELAAAFAELRRRSETDGLTGLLNHRATHQALGNEVARGRRYGTPFGLLMLDIDDLKLLNDAHGHPAGDGLLRQVSHLLQEHTRQVDYVGRVGGDEFMIVLPETRSDTAYSVARKIRAAISATPYVTPDGQQIPVRVCIGTASYPEDGSEANVLVARADANLYASKRRGGNSITRREEDIQQGEPEPGAFGMLEALVAAVDNKDSYTAQHSEEVTSHAMTIATALGFSEESLGIVRVAGLLHDVGKIGTPGSILRKPGRLTSDEFEIMKRHPSLGGLLIQEIPGSAEIRAAVVSHHERWDGTGYPDGLAGESIPLIGRIMAVADALSAMTSDRPYRSGMSLDEAVRELRAGAGTQFDPALVEPLVEALLEQATSDPRGSLAGTAG